MSISCSKWHRWESEAISSTGFVPDFPDIDSVYALVKHVPSGVPVTSGVPQGSVLGPELFLIYVNDIDTRITSRISKFADDTKLCKRVDKPELRLQLQEDINKLAEWSDRWMMPFKASKCTVVHLGCHNRNHQYAMDGNQITSVSLQQDLGILISSDLRWDHAVKTSPLMYQLLM